MGKWSNRPSRRFFRGQRSPRSAPKFYDLGAPLPEFWQDGIPIWEKKFCTLMGSVPWQKLVDTKVFMYCHSNVLNWNDSAAEEAFQNAKKHYWAKINGIPCDISPPDPDTYVDEIDWNPHIDTEMIKELDCAYFAPPDDAESGSMKNERPESGESPLECDDAELNGLENKKQKWSQWDSNVNDSSNVDNSDNPWELTISRRKGELSNNAWEGGGVKLWGWKQGSDHNNQSRDWGKVYNPWENGCPGIISPKDKGWGSKERDCSWNQKQSNSLVNIDNPWECKSSQCNKGPIGRGWKNYGANEWGWKQHENANASSNFQYGKNGGGWSSRKREGSIRYTSGYNRSQFQRDDHQVGHYHSRVNSKRRVSFAPE